MKIKSIEISNVKGIGHKKREQQLWSAAMFLYALNVCKLGEK